MRYAKWPHYPHGYITHISPIYNVRFINNNFKLISHTIIESQNGT